ncbi:MAG: FAD-dependent oxidoreductase [Coriobacteriales bacterium]|jgi:2,4-dienoyl-CoA reductase-like NADH-dependent reductase (Old Yellow Enzyme family)/thioredoxin reductase
MKTKYPHLFRPYTIKNLTLRNRIIASPNMSGWPTREGSADLNCLADMVAQAKGGVAVITMGETAVNRNDAVRGHVSFLDQERQLQGSATSPMHMHVKLVESVTRHGALACIQLCHAGETANDFFSRGHVFGPMGYVRDDGVQVYAMNESDMEKVCEDFERAAHLAVVCGYQIVQVHCGHGWLISQFLSPRTNKREDEYGGSLENRAKFPLRIIDAVRRGAGPDTIIELRVSGEEYLEGGMRVEEVAEFVKLAEDEIDLVQVTSGSRYYSPQYAIPSIFQPHGIAVDDATFIKQRVKVPVGVVGGLSDPAQCEAIIAEGKADFICMTRQLLADPEFPIKVYEGREEDVRPCLRCSNCLGLKGKTSHHGCDVNPLTANGAFMFNSIQPVQGRRRVLVAGGGAAGMVAAITACDRGHEVILASSAEALGGMMRHADKIPFKDEMRRYKDYLVTQVSKRDIDVRLNTPVTEALYDEINPDYVIAATGSTPKEAAFADMGSLKHMDAFAACDRLGELGERVAVIGGGVIGCEIAIHLARSGKQVVIIEKLDAVAEDTHDFYAAAIMEQIGISGIEVRTGLCCERFSPEGVTAIDAEGGEVLVPCDSAVLAVGMKPNREPAEMLRAKAGFARFRDVGDCVAPGQLRQAVHHAYFAAMDIV